MSAARSKDRMRFDRSDRIATAVLLWFVVGASAAYTLFISLDWILRRQVTLTGVPVEVDVDAAGTGRVIPPVEAAVLVQDVSAGHFALLVLPLLVTVAATVWGALLLTRFVADLGRGEPFGAANVARLRIVGILLLAVPLSTELLGGIARSAILEARGQGGFSFDFTPGWLVAGLLVAALAQAFATGTRLRDDVDGLV